MNFTLSSFSENLIVILNIIQLNIIQISINMFFNQKIGKNLY